MPKPLVDHFGLISSVYELFIRAPDTARLAMLLDLNPGQLLLDIGGGTGRVTQGLQHTGARLFLLDASWGMLWQAREKGCCAIAQAVAEGLPFRDGSAPRIVAVDSFHHFWDQKAAAKELIRVLAPGGRLVIEEPNVHHLAARLVAWGERIALMRSRFYPPDALVALFEPLGVGVQLHCPSKSPIFWAVIQKSC